MPLSEFAKALLGFDLVTKDQVIDPDTGEPVDWDALGGASFHGASVFLDANLSIGANNNVVTWTDEEYDTDGIWSPGAPTRLTVPTGFTLAQVMSTGIVGDGGNYFETKVFKNGDVNNPVTVAQHFTSDFNTGIIAISRWLPVVAGDYFEDNFRSNINHTVLAAAAYSPYFSIELRA